MQEEKIRPLHIVVLAELRSKAIREMCEIARENDEQLDDFQPYQGRMTMKDGTSFLAVTLDPQHIKGRRADQVIICGTFRFHGQDLSEAVGYLLSQSCVPDGYRLIFLEE